MGLRWGWRDEEKLGEFLEYEGKFLGGHWFQMNRNKLGDLSWEEHFKVKEEWIYAKVQKVTQHGTVMGEQEAGCSPVLCKRLPEPKNTAGDKKRAKSSSQHVEGKCALQTFLT